jgi:hypothetical protein
LGQEPSCETDFQYGLFLNCSLKSRKKASLPTTFGGHASFKNGNALLDLIYTGHRNNVPQSRGGISASGRAPRTALESALIC